MQRWTLALAALSLVACAQPADSAFAGLWTGTKYFYDAGGTRQASSPDWWFEITGAGSSCQFTNGPKAHVDSDGLLRLERHEFPPSYPPGPQGHCVPVMEVVTGGTGRLVSANALELSVSWTSSCGGTTSTFSTSYTMERRSEAPPTLPYLEL